MFLLGQQLGKYQILETLGSGGFGTVYLVKDTWIDKKFAIKIPLEQWTEEVNEGRASVDDYFVLKNLCARIDELVAAKDG